VYVLQEELLEGSPQKIMGQPQEFPALQRSRAMSLSSLAVATPWSAGPGQRKSQPEQAAWQPACVGRQDSRAGVEPTCVEDVAEPEWAADPEDDTEEDPGVGADSRASAEGEAGSASGSDRSAPDPRESSLGAVSVETTVYSMR
jgi:hypothetical protein